MLVKSIKVKITENAGKGKRGERDSGIKVVRESA